MDICPRSAYNVQIRVMTDYVAVLEARAVMEGIELIDRQTCQPGS